jgi:hypothetical protein
MTKRVTFRETWRRTRYVEFTKTAGEKISKHEMLEICYGPPIGIHLTFEEAEQLVTALQIVMGSAHADAQ